MGVEKGEGGGGWGVGIAVLCFVVALPLGVRGGGSIKFKPD